MYKNVVLIGSQKYHPEDHLASLKQFDTLTEAKKYASRYENVTAARIYFYNDSGHYSHCKEFK